MPTVENEIVIERPQGVVWGYLIDPSNASVWQSNVVEFEGELGGEGSVGRTVVEIAETAQPELFHDRREVDARGGKAGAHVVDDPGIAAEARQQPEQLVKVDAGFCTRQQGLGTRVVVGVVEGLERDFEENFVPGAAGSGGAVAHRWRAGPRPALLDIGGAFAPARLRVPGAAPYGPAYGPAEVIHSRESPADRVWPAA
jgi:hypothetical protein